MFGFALWISARRDAATVIRVHHVYLYGPTSAKQKPNVTIAGRGSINIYRSNPFVLKRKTTTRATRTTEEALLLLCSKHMGQHAVRPAAAILNAALLLVLFKCSRSVGAFVFTHPNTCKSTLKGSSGRHCTCALPPTQLSPSRARAVLLHENVGRLPAAGVVRRPCAPAAVYVGRGMAQRTRCYAAGGTRGAGVVDGRTGYGPEANRRGILAQQHKKGGDTGAGGDCEGAGGFEWLREFGNGKMDITGLVLSTVLLMTAAAPLG